MRPIEIIGGGLAGLSLGHALRIAGVPVTLFEAGNYPRHRVCGEFITGLSETTIRRIALGPFLQDAHRHADIAWFAQGRLTQRQRLPQPALAMSRYRLDERLAQAFTAAGGSLQVQQRVPDESPPAGRILATGRRRTASPWLGLKVHALHFEVTCDLEVHLGNHAYVGVTRVEDGRVNICGLFKRQDLRSPGAALLCAYLEHGGLGGLARRLRQAEVDATSFSAVAAIGFDAHAPRVDSVGVGDRCAMIPPFTGNGMAMAFQSAEVALTPLLEYAQGSQDWPDTVRTINARLRARFATRLAAADWLHPFLLEPARQRWLTRLSQARLLPLRPLYALLH